MSWRFGHSAKRLDLKDKVDFKFYDVIAWLLTIVIHILPNISRSKGNQTMKFDQLIEYKMRNIFLEKSCTKCGGETRKLKLSISLDQYSFHTVVFIASQVEYY